MNSGSDAQIVLSPVTQKSAVAKAFTQISNKIRLAAGVTVKHTVGAPGGSDELRVRWIPKLNIWVCAQPYSSRRSRHWIGYGLVDPRTTSSGLNIRVETALPPSGINRRIAGLLARDANGNVYLLHSGKIGGGKQGFGKTFFWQHYGGDAAKVRFEDGDLGYALIGCIADGDFLERVADFVHGVDAMRRRDSKYVWRFPRGSAARDYVDKKRGVSAVQRSIGDTKMLHEHNEILNALKDCLQAYACVESVKEDVQRDPHVVLKGGATIDIELKPAITRQDIYTGVGQLLLNQDRRKPSILALVTPKKVSEAQELLERLSELSIKHVGYESSQRKKIKFFGLDGILSSVQP